MPHGIRLLHGRGTDCRALAEAAVATYEQRALADGAAHELASARMRSYPRGYVAHALRRVALSPISSRR